MIDRRLVIALGMAATLAATALWHGPIGTGSRFAGEIETVARRTLEYYEMAPVEARLERQPLTRRLVLTGPADDFQRGELVRIMGSISGVGEARWSDSPADGMAVPLLVEAMMLAMVGFGLGLLIAYFGHLRRRANADWRW